MASKLSQVAASAKVADGRVWLKSITLAAGADAASVVVDDSTDGSGSDLLTLKAAAGTTATWRSGDKQGVFFGTALYAAITGTAPAVSFEYEQG